MIGIKLRRKYFQGCETCYYELVSYTITMKIDIMRELNEWEKTLDKDVFRSKEADALGAFSISEASGFQSFSDKLRFIQEHCEEKDPAKLFPGPHFGELGMNLLPAFKNELSLKTEEMCAKRLKFSTTDLTWIAAKGLASNESLYNHTRKRLGDNLTSIIEAARTFTP